MYALNDSADLSNCHHRKSNNNKYIGMFQKNVEHKLNIKLYHNK